MSFRLKDALLVGGLALMTSWSFQYLFSPGKSTSEDGQRSGQSFTASPLDIRPLNTEVDFIDLQNAKRAPTQREVIETEKARFTFTNQGATLERLEFKKIANGRSFSDLTTIYPVSEVDRENRCFLIAFDENTPYEYSKTDLTEDADRIQLTYRASLKEGTITKTFTIYKERYKIDMKVAVEIDTQESYRARVFFPAPLLPDIRQDDIISGLVLNDKESLEIIPLAKLDFRRGWFAPGLFGSQDKYFIHALITDPTHFVQRAYYHKVSGLPLYAIVEGPLHTASSSWTLSFYCGPKESAALSAVDPRLEQTLEHAGIFAPLSRGLLAILVFLFSYLGNYGLAIIALTVLIRVLLWPLSLRSARVMNNGKTDAMQKRLKYIEIKYKDDPERLAQERSAVLREQGSMFVSGCLPQLLQLPVMAALNRALSNSILLYGAPFLWIPDLSSRDPYMILPGLIVMAMLLQARYVDKQQRLTMMMVALILGAVSTTVSAGLALYFAASMLIGLVQSVVQKKMKMV